MMTLNQALMAAQTTPSGTPEFQAACDICQIRGIDPNRGSSRTIIHAPNWQLVIAEQLLEQTLRDAMMQPR